MSLSFFFFRMRNVSDESCRENQNTHFVFNNFFENRAFFLDNMEKYCIAGQVTDDNTTHANCKPDTQDYRRTLGICNMYCFSAVTL